MLPTLKFYVIYQIVGLISLVGASVLVKQAKSCSKTETKSKRKNTILNSDPELYATALAKIGKSTLKSLRHL